jgi:hypothetical protein
VQVDHIHIQNTGFAGIMAKTDPSCKDSLTWRKNGFVLRNLHIHNNYIHHTHGEGMYIGYTGSYKTTSKVICDGEYAMGHWLENVLVENNRLEDIGWDGIQVNLVQNNGIIRNNTIVNYGLEQEPVQNFGMSIGGGVYDILNNVIINGPANEQGLRGVGALGMQLINGESGSKILGNIFIRPGAHAIFLHNRSPFENKKNGYTVAHNTIISPGESGIFYNAGITTSLDESEIGGQQLDVPFWLFNNVVVNPGNDYSTSNFWKKNRESFYDFNTRELRDAQEPYHFDNVYTRNIDSLGFVDVATDDYRLSATSVLINQGYGQYNSSPADMWGIERGIEGGWDIGASEYSSIPAAIMPKNSRQLLHPLQQNHAFTLHTMSYSTFTEFLSQNPNVWFKIYDSHANQLPHEQIGEWPGVYWVLLLDPKSVQRQWIQLVVQ